MTIRLVLVDDHAPFRGYMAALLSKQSDIAVIGQAEDAESLLQLLAGLGPDDRPDLLVVDVEMGGGGGVEATRRALALSPALHVMALSMHDDPAFVSAMVAAGARGYVLKADSLPDIVTGIREVAAGRKYFSRSLGYPEA